MILKRLYSSLRLKQSQLSKETIPAARLRYAAWWWEALYSKKTNFDRRIELQFENNYVQFNREVKDLREFGAKYFENDCGNLLNEADSVVLPNLMRCNGLVGMKGGSLLKSIQSCSTTVVLLIKLRESGENSLKPCRQMLKNTFEPEINQGRLGLIDLILTENSIYKYFNFLIEPRLKREYKSLNPNVLLHYGPCRDFRMELGIRNSLVGWVYLLDTNQVVRWSCHSSPTTRELEALAEATRTLLNN